MAPTMIRHILLAILLICLIITENEGFFLLNKLKLKAALLSGLSKSISIEKEYPAAVTTQTPPPPPPKYGTPAPPVYGPPSTYGPPPSTYGTPAPPIYGPPPSTYGTPAPPIYGPPPAPTYGTPAPPTYGPPPPVYGTPAPVYEPPPQDSEPPASKRVTSSVTITKRLKGIPIASKTFVVNQETEQL